jgi:predicted acylesterase/phospholipase RssA
VRRNLAINSLRGFGAFRYASLRLLDDLLETVGTGELARGEVEPYVDYARRASFSLYWSLDLRFWHQQYTEGADVPRAHEICLCSSRSLTAPLEALAHLLAHTIAHQFDEPAAVVALKPDGTFSAWDRGNFVGPHALPASRDTASILHEINKVLPGQRPFVHLIYAVPRPESTPSLLERFHRIVYINEQPDLAAVPAHLRDLLKPAVWGKDDARRVPRFSAFIATQFLGDRNPSAASRGDVLSRLSVGLDSLCAASTLRTQPSGESFECRPQPPAWRMRRDRCHPAVDLTNVDRAWREWNGGRTQSSFAEALFARHPRYRGSIQRWARAVTNRQVGVALSGGGASAFRMVPLLRSFARELDIPVDVVGGVSGGAMLAAYYCVEGLPGLEKAIASGDDFMLFALGAIVNSRVIRVKIDWDLAATRIEDLEIRFVPLTTVLRHDHPPEAHAVIAGTVGEAVRVSGSAPVLWGQTVHRRRHYSDGATAMLIPARALKEHGADVVYAANCVPGPNIGNPLTYYLNHYGIPPLRLGDFLSDYTALGRVADAWIAAAYFAQQASREMEEDAHVYLEPEPENVPFLESLAFYQAARLAAESEDELAERRGIGRDIARCAHVWEKFRRSPRLIG